MFQTVFDIIFAIVILGTAFTILFWEFKKKRSAEKTYEYHLRIVLNSGKIIRLTLGEELYQQFNQLLNQETGKFQINSPNKADTKIQDASTMLYMQYIAAVTMRRW
jgi:hypothetical protein